jgi:nicotinamidase-related amidase
VTVLPDLNRAALVVIDMHRGSIDPPGTVYVPAGAAIVPTVARLVDGARAAAVPVFFIVHQIRPDGADAMSPFWREATGVLDLYPNVGEQLVGSNWAELASGLEARSGDYVLPKKRYGAFSGNDLAFQLRNLGVETIVLAGVETEICVLATAFHAFNEDYRVVVARDAVAALDAELGVAALRIVEREVGWVADSDEIVSALEAAHATGASAGAASHV